LKKELKIAVRDLVSHVLRSGDLTFEFLSSTRPIDAIRIHQKIQQSRPDNYIAEVPISIQVESELLILSIGGRIDGIYFQSNGVLIEEIKTTTRNPDYFEQHKDSIHWGQLKCYAYIYAVDQDLDVVDTQLTYYQMDTGDTRTFKQRCTRNELESFFQGLSNDYLRWVETIVKWEALRDASIRDLEFPYGEYRPGQREMAVGIYRTIKDNGQLLVQAATGIGKTMAAIFPAIKAIGEGLNTKVFYLTARTTGRIAAEKALDELRQRHLKLKSLSITAKDKICFKPDSACNPEECEYARGYFDRIDGALKDVFCRDALTRQAVEQTARSHRICPFEFSLELALWADCIICDYNYAFDPRVFLRRFFQEERGDYTFLIDEAHNMVDRSREMFSAEIFKQPFLDMRRVVRRQLPQIYKHLGKINSWMVKARKKCNENGGEYHEKESPAKLLSMLRSFLKITERWLSRDINAPFREELIDLYFAISSFVKVAEQYDENYATCFETLKKDLKIKLFCIDPSTQLKNALNRCRSAVFFSATMTPMGYFKKILGCSNKAAGMTLPSPFSRDNFSLFVSDNVSTLYRDREKTKQAVSGVIRTLIRQKKGNYLLFFPSYEYLTMVFDSFKAAYRGDSELIAQNPGMSESERDEFLNRFGRKVPNAIVGFAVMGGIFGEGIDLVGEQLSGAVIVGVGLPGISMERELIRDYFANTYKQGFEYAYQYPGINRVLQAIGRVIRTETDRGIVLLIDQRYATYRYRSFFPKEWLPVRVQNHKKLANDLQAFWNTQVT
jgi:DNA excision repair protein ERCC-2